MANLVIQSREAIGADHSVLSPDTWPEAQEMLQAARETTGLDDFGGEDFVEALEQLLASLRDESQIEGAARTNAKSLLLRRLQNRLLVEQWHAANPQASEVSITGPVAITGLPRTGTTALGNLLSLDRQFRPLRSWEQASPLPPPVAATEQEDPRRLATLAGIERLVRDDPQQMAMHLFDADATEEDHDVLGMACAAQHNTWGVPAYRTWWRGADMRSAYRYHRRVLQLLQSARPPHFWMLKAPHYKFHMEAIRDAWPDVRLVFTHRDPVKSIASYFSFVTNFYPAGTVERIGAKQIARDIYHHLLEGMKAAMAARDRMGEAAFVDVSQSGLNRDTMGTLEALYDGLGLPFTAQFKADVASWHERNRSGAHGSHSYSAADFGFTESEIAADFAFYRDRFADQF